MKPPIYLIFFLFMGLNTFAQNELPQIDNTLIQWFESNSSVMVQFTIIDPDNEEVLISFSLEDDFCNETVFHEALFPTNEGITLNFTLSERPNNVLITADDNEAGAIDDLVQQVSEDSLMQHLEQLTAGNRHRTADPDHLAFSKDYISQLFTQYCLDTSAVPFAYGANYTAHNIIGELNNNSNKTVIIDAHFDTVFDSPGADDNGSGTVGVIEAARILSQFDFTHNIRFIGFDLEEEGLLGSINYVSSLTESDTILGVFNYEMIGYYDTTANTQSVPTGFSTLFPDAYQTLADNDFRGDFINNVANANSLELMMLFDEMAALYVPELKTISFAEPANTSIDDLRRSDHAPFWEANIPALMLTNGANFRNDNYHEPSDVVDSINLQFMANVVKAVIASVANLAELKHSTSVSVAVEDPNGLTAIPNKMLKFITEEKKIYFNSPDKIDQLNIYNLSGQKTLNHIDLEAQSTLNLDHLNSGIYLIEIQIGTQQYFQKICIP